MSALHGLSLSRRLARTFAVLVLVILLVGAAGFGGLLAMGGAHAQEQRLQRMQTANTAMLLEMANVETGVRGYRLAQQRSFLGPYEEGRAAFPEHVAQARELALPDERGLVHAQVAVAERWFDVYGEPVSAMAPGEVEVSAELTQTNKEIFDAYRTANGALADLLETRVEQAQARAGAVRAAALAGSALAVALALGVSLVAARRIRGSLVGPLDDVVTVLRQLSAGDHAARSDDRRGPREVRVVARSVNRLADESDRLRTERGESARLQELGVEIGHRIREQLDAQESLVRAVTLLGQGLVADRVWVRLLDDAGLGPATAQWARPGLDLLAVPAIGDGSAGWAQALHERGGVLRVEDLDAGQPLGDDLDGVADGLASYLRPFAARTGSTAVLALPVGAGGSAIGSLTVTVGSGPRRWTDGEVALARSVAADLGRALVLARLYRQQQKLVEQLQELDRTKTDFVSTISHELRTPLTSISGYLELLRDGDAGALTPEADRMLAVVERNTLRLRSLIEDLLTLSRIESGAFRATYRDVLLDEVVEAAVASVRPVADAAGVRLQVDVPPPGGEGGGEVVVAGDPVQLDRVLLNLLSNAVKFTPRDGCVRLAVHPREEDVVVEVEDTGMGIPERDQERLFTRFFRATNAVDAAVPGTGLGLLIVRSIVEHHDGHLVLRSEEGVGTVVTVRLPRRRADPHLPAPRAVPDPVRAAAG